MNWRVASLAPRNTPPRLTATTLLKFSSDVSSNGIWPNPISGIPALQYITSRRPKASTAVCTAAAMSSSLVTSARRRHRFTPRLLDLVDQRSEMLIDEVGGDDLGALGGEEACGLAPESVPRTGDRHDFVLEPHGVPLRWSVSETPLTRGRNRAGADSRSALPGCGTRELRLRPGGTSGCARGTGRSRCGARGVRGANRDTGESRSRTRTCGIFSRSKSTSSG